MTQKEKNRQIDSIRALISQHTEQISWNEMRIAVLTERLKEFKKPKKKSKK